MLNIENAADCTGCGACAAICPKRCISMTADSEGFKYPIIDKSKCISCNLCEKTCLRIKNEHYYFESSPRAFGVINKNENIRKKSSSGGIFVLLANHILDKQGIVYGAAFTDDYMEVKHMGITTFDELFRLQGSKYVQSKTDCIYAEVKNNLDTGIPVLFSGTPCQIAGLKGYLNKDYNNLVCVEVICHGAPSPKVWKKYIEYFSNKWKTKVIHVQFRDKDNKQFRKNGQNNIKIIGENNKSYTCANTFDPYYNLFLSNISLRPSCYKCNYKNKNHCADIVIADFWGADKVVPGFGKHGDLSLVLLRNSKAIDLFDKIKQDAFYKEVDALQALGGNRSYYKSVDMPTARTDFFNELDQKSIVELSKLYANPGLYKRIIYFVDKVGLLKPLKKLLGKNR